MWFAVNLLSLAVGFIGSVVIYFFGVPRVTDTGGADYIITERVNQDELDRIQLHKRLGRLGLVLLALSFAGQFAVAIAAH